MADTMLCRNDVKIITKYYKNMLHEYVFAGHLKDPSLLENIHHVFSSLLFKSLEEEANCTLVSSNIIECLNKEYNDVRQRFLVTSMKKIDALIRGLKENYEDEIAEYIAQMLEGKIASSKVIEHHLSLHKKYGESLKESITKAINNEHMKTHRHALEEYIEKIWNQHILENPILKDKNHKKVAPFAEDEKTEEITGFSNIVKPKYNMDDSTPNPTSSKACASAAGLVRLKPQSDVIFTGSGVQSTSEAHSVVSGLVKSNTQQVEGNNIPPFWIRDRTSSLDNLSTRTARKNDCKLMQPGQQTAKLNPHNRIKSSSSVNMGNILELKEKSGESNNENVSFSATAEEKIDKLVFQRRLSKPPLLPKPQNVPKGMQSQKQIRSPSELKSVVVYMSSNSMRFNYCESAADDGESYYPLSVSLLSNNKWELGDNHQLADKIFYLDQDWEKVITRDIKEIKKIRNSFKNFFTKKESPKVEFILSRIMLSIKCNESFNENEADCILVGVPLWFSSKRRQLLLDSANCAGFRHTHIFNETSLSALHMYTSNKIPLEHELVIFSLNSKNVDIAMYKSTGFTVSMLGSRGMYEEDFLNVSENIKNAIELVLKQANVEKTVSKRSVLICAKNELDKQYEELFISEAKIILISEKDLYIVNNAAFNGLVDILNAPKFSKSEGTCILVNDKRPVNVQFRDDKAEILSDMSLFKFSGSHNAINQIKILHKCKKIVVNEKNVFKKFLQIGTIEVDHPVAKLGELLFDVDVDQNGIFYIVKVERDKIFESDTHFDKIDFQWMPEKLSIDEKKTIIKKLK